MGDAVWGIVSPSEDPDGGDGIPCKESLIWGLYLPHGIPSEEIVPFIKDPHKQDSIPPSGDPLGEIVSRMGDPQ